jgi:hypothetical protein
VGKLLSAEDADAAEENKSKIKDIENNIFLYIVFVFFIKLAYNIHL